ncbi:MAG: hypothetical protein F4X56_08340 [Gammaproteobacteria bacterium]|nr:hypothetical protein [Gammaproteobacteria bacterium]
MTSIVGLFGGIVIGISVYTLALWIFVAPDADLSRGGSKSQIENTSVAIFGEHQTDVNKLFSAEFSYVDVNKVIETFGLLSPQELRELIEESSSQPWTSGLYTVQQILIEYLVQTNPEEAIASISQISDYRRLALLRVIFKNWSKANLEQALTTAVDLSLSDRHIAIDAVIATRRGLSTQAMSQLANRFNLRSEITALEQEIMAYETLDEGPLRAIELLVRDEIDDEQQIERYRQVVETWFQSDGLNSVLMLENTGLDGAVFNELFDQVTQHDRRAALAFFSDFDERRRDRFGTQLINNWVRDNEEDAFQAILGLPQSSFRRSMLRALAYAWGRKDPNAILDRIFEIPRTVRDDALSTAALELANDRPKELLDQLSTLRTIPGANVDRAMQSAMRTWSAEAPKLALEWIQNNTEEGTNSRTGLLREVLPNYALIEPEEAMTIAGRETSADYFGSRLQATVINSLLYADRLDTVLELLETERVGFPIFEYANVGSELVKNDRLDDAIALSDSINENERTNYFSWVATRLMIWDRASAVVEMIASLPTSELQSDVAEQLLNERMITEGMTNEQLDSLRAFVSE